MIRSKAIRVLFFGEGATLAHVGRPLLLAESLRQCSSFEVLFARPPAYSWMTDGSSVPSVDLSCQSPDVFSKRLTRGSPLYDLGTLQDNVVEDRELIRRFRPDVVIGDFRLSLSVSARLEGIPYATICDAYWSPEAPDRPPPLPALPLTRHVPLSVGQKIFSAISPLAFWLHSRPMEQLRKSHGLPGFSHDLRLAYTDADLRLFANPPALFSDLKVHRGAAFIGPLCWSPSMALPTGFPESNGFIYVTLGSSGHLNVLAPLFDVLGERNQTVVVASAGRKLPELRTPPNIHMFDFLPGDALVARAALVICNGGSPTTYQALMAGTPVLGIPGNMDQMLNMRAITRAGCGLSVRADRAKKATLSQAIQELTDDACGFRQRAKTLQANPNREGATIEALEMLIPQLLRCAGI